MGKVLVNENFPVFSGALVTAGEVVFYGMMDRWLKALDARTSAELWRFRTTSEIASQPITFHGPLTP
jgi:alcohol dehydrogenase (cytochrome c)